MFLSNKIICILFLVIFKVSIISAVGPKLDEIFRDEDCVPGQLLFDGTTVLLNPVKDTKTDIKVQESPSKETETHLLVTLPTAVQNEKNPLLSLNELAQYNDINVNYLIIDEHGPPHDKVFELRLTLGKEIYQSSAKSIKKAKMSAALEALAKTKYKFPPQAIQTVKQVEQLTPTVQINNIAAKLGLKVEYINGYGRHIDEDDLLEDNNSATNYYSLDSSTKSYLQQLNDSMQYKGKHVKVPSGETLHQGPFKVRLIIGNNVFYGGGITIQAARHDAASNALQHFKKMSVKDAEACLEQGEVCNKLAVKSPISLVMETAMKRGLSVQFENVGASGPAHKREFMAMCKVGDLVTKGQGLSQKAAKTRASELMLAELEKVQPISVGNQLHVNTNTSPKKKKKKKIGRGVLDNVKTNVFDAVTSAMSAMSMGGEPQRDMSLSDSSDGSSSSDDSVEPSKKGTLLKLGRAIGIDIQFSTFPDDLKFSSIVSIHTEPSYVCYNKAESKELAEENASITALLLIKNIGLANIRLPLKSTKGSKPMIATQSKDSGIEVIRKI